jgi:DNA-binding transcriptional LysR family regulator
MVSAAGLADGSEAVQAQTKEALQHVPLSQLLIGSDSPWHTPQNLEDQYLRTLRNEPGNIAAVVQALCEVYPDSTREQLSTTLKANAIQFFGMEALTPEQLALAEAAAAASAASAASASAAAAKERPAVKDGPAEPPSASSSASASSSYYSCQRCRKKLFGLVNCCKGGGTDGSLFSAFRLITGAGGQAIGAIGSSYTYDALFTADAPDLVIAGFEGLFGAGGGSSALAGLIAGDLSVSSFITSLVPGPWTIAMLAIQLSGLLSCEQAEQILALYDRIPDALSDEKSLIGRLLIGAIQTALSGPLPNALLTLRRDHPGLRVHVAAGMSAELAQRVADGELDAAITSQPVRPHPAELVWSTLYEDRFWLLAPPQYAKHDARALLTELPFIRFDAQAWAGRMIASELRRLGVRVREEMVLDNKDTIVQMVARGLGAAVVALSDAVLTQLPPITRLPFGQPQTRRAVVLLEHQSRPAERFTQALADAVVESAMSISR